jgi:hypothetical protein
VTDTITREQLTPPQLDGLHVVAEGPTAISTRTETDPERGVRSVNGTIAAVLLGLGLASRVPQWNAIEITELGRTVLNGK